MERLLSIWNVFLKIGVIGFGGGSALIPVIEKEVVENKKWFTDEEYLKHTVIANITPGALPVKLGAIAGYEKGGGIGSLLGAYAVTMPGAIFTVVMLTLFSVLGEKITHYIEFASVGISIFIINLLLIYVIKIIKSGKANNLYKTNIIICIMAFILTGGKEIRSLIFNVVDGEIEVLKFTIFDISTINLMVASFFIILFYGLLKSKKSFIIGITITFIYVFINGKNNIISPGGFTKILLPLIMGGLVIYAMIKSRKEKKYINSMVKTNIHNDENIKFNINRQSKIAIGLFIVIPMMLLLLSVIMFPSEINNGNVINKLTGDVAISTMTSFGGGEAYVSVADGFFVQTGIIKASDFYNKIVSIANALPGPILVKITSGIGFIFADSIQGIIYGWIIALLAMSTAVGACSIIAILVLIGYDALGNSEELKLIKKFILPVVCGMLISTSLSMIAEAMKVTKSVGIAGITSIFSIVIAIIGLYIIHKKYHVNDLIMLVSTAVSSFIVLSLF